MQPIFVTGTDTGVGKTTVAAHLVKQLRAAGLDAGYWKPIETGVPDGQPQDVAYVQSICGPAAPALGWLALPEPLAPNVAARRAGRPINVAELNATADRLTKMYRPLVIEGAGGLLVHVTDELTFADFAGAWGARMLLVVANRLGCLNHAELTVNELRRRGLDLGGWVLNHVSDIENVATQSNLAELTRLLGQPLAVVGYGKTAEAKFVTI